MASSVPRADQIPSGGIQPEPAPVHSSSTTAIYSQGRHATLYPRLLAREPVLVTGYASPISGSFTLGNRVRRLSTSQTPLNWTAGIAPLIRTGLGLQMPRQQSIGRLEATRPRVLTCKGHSGLDSAAACSRSESAFRGSASSETPAHGTVFHSSFSLRDSLLRRTAFQQKNLCDIRGTSIRGSRNFSRSISSNSGSGVNSSIGRSGSGSSSSWSVSDNLKISKRRPGSYSMLLTAAAATVILASALSGHPEQGHFPGSSSVPEHSSEKGLSLPVPDSVRSVTTRAIHSAKNFRDHVVRNASQSASAAAEAAAQARDVAVATAALARCLAAILSSDSLPDLNVWELRDYNEWRNSHDLRRYRPAPLPSPLPPSPDSTPWVARVARTIADLAAAGGSSSRAAIADASRGKVLDWLLEELVNSDPRVRREAARAVASLLRDVDVAPRVLNRDGSIRQILTWIAQLDSAANVEAGRSANVSPGAAGAERAGDHSGAGTSASGGDDSLSPPALKASSLRLSSARLRHHPLVDALMDLLTEPSPLKQDSIQSRHPASLLRPVIRPLGGPDLAERAADVDVRAALDVLIWGEPVEREESSTWWSRRGGRGREGGKGRGGSGGGEGGGGSEAGGSGAMGIGLGGHGGTTVWGVVMDAANETLPRVCAPEAGALLYRNRSVASEDFSNGRTSRNSFDQARLPGSGQEKETFSDLSTPGLWDDLPGQSVAALLAAWAVDKWTTTSASNCQLIARMDGEGDALAVGAVAPEKMVRFHVARAIGRVAQEQEMCLYRREGGEGKGGEKDDGLFTRAGVHLGRWRDAAVEGAQKAAGAVRKAEEKPVGEGRMVEKGRTKVDGREAGALKVQQAGIGGTGAAAAAATAAAAAKSSIFLTPTAIRSWSLSLLKSALPPASAFQQGNSDVTVAVLHAVRTLSDISDDVARISSDAISSTDLAEPSLREEVALEALPQLRRILAASTRAAAAAGPGSGSGFGAAPSAAFTKRRDSNAPSARAVSSAAVAAGKGREGLSGEGVSVEEREAAEEEEMVNLAVAQAVASLVLGRQAYEAAAVGRLIGAAGGGAAAGRPPAPVNAGAPAPAAAAEAAAVAASPSSASSSRSSLSLDELRAWGPVLVKWACGVMRGGGETNEGTGGGATGAAVKLGKAGGAAEGTATARAAAGLLAGRRQPARSFLESDLVQPAAVAATAAAGQAVLVEVLSAAVRAADAPSDSAVAAVDARRGEVTSGERDDGEGRERGRAKGGREKGSSKGGRAGSGSLRVGRGVGVEQVEGAEKARQAGVVVGGEGVGREGVGREGVGRHELEKEWTDVAVGVGLLWLSEMVMCAVTEAEARRNGAKGSKAGAVSGEGRGGGAGRKGEVGKQGGGKGVESVGMTVATMKYLESLWRGGKGTGAQEKREEQKGGEEKEEIAQAGTTAVSAGSTVDQLGGGFPAGKSSQGKALLGERPFKEQLFREQFLRRKAAGEQPPGAAGGRSEGEGAAERSWWSYVNPWGGAGGAGGGRQAAGGGSGQPQGRGERAVGGRAERVGGHVSGQGNAELGGALSEKHKAVRDEALRSASSAVVRLGEVLGHEAWGWGGGDGGRGEGKGVGTGGRKDGGMVKGRGGLGSEKRSSSRAGSMEINVEDAEWGEVESGVVREEGGEDSLPVSSAGKANKQVAAAAAAAGRNITDNKVKVTVDEMVKAAEEEHEHLMDLLGLEGGLYSTRSGLVASNEDKSAASEEPPRVNVLEALDAAAAAVKALAELASEDWAMQERVVAGGGVELMRRLLIGQEYWEWVRGEEEELRRQYENGAGRGGQKGAEVGRSQIDGRNYSSSSSSSSSSSNTSGGSESSRRESAGSECEKKDLLIRLAATAAATAIPNSPPGSQPNTEPGIRPATSQAASATLAATTGNTLAAPARTVAATADVAAEEELEAARVKLTKLRRNAARLLAQLSAHPDSWAAIAGDQILIGWLEQCTKGGGEDGGRDRRDDECEKGSGRKRRTAESSGSNSEAKSPQQSEHDPLLCEVCVSKKMRSNARKVLAHAAPAVHAMSGSAVEIDASTPLPTWHECDVAVPGWHEAGKRFTPRYDDGIFFIHPTNPWLQANSLPDPLSDPLASPSSPPSSSSSPSTPASSSSTPSAPVLDVVFVHGLRGGPFKSWRRGEAVPAAAPAPGVAMAPVAKAPAVRTPVARKSVAGAPVAGAPVAGAPVGRIVGASKEQEAAASSGGALMGKGDGRSATGPGQVEVNEAGVEPSMAGQGGSVGHTPIQGVGDVAPLLVGEGRSVEPTKLLEATLREEEEGGKKGSCWPCDWLARDLSGARILTTKYRTNLSEWAGATLPLEDISIILLHKLVAAGVGERPVVFVTHSMGGLIVKQILALAHTSDLPEIRAIADSTAGIVFYSVPHFGSRIADYSWRARAVLRPAPSADCLRMSSPHIEGLNTTLRHMYKQGKVQVLSFAETKVTPLVKTYGGLTLRLEVVPLESAYPGYGAFVVLDGTDHINACKPVSTSDPAYADTLDFLLKLRDQAFRSQDKMP
ncbi:hypothetical protein CLOP_g21023 [Closterium sp. NIES-67]|nr:hypothetical protein CLOP_g21023 [Closterium sp. NIES-67]